MKLLWLSSGRDWDKLAKAHPTRFQILNKISKNSKLSKSEHIFALSKDI